MARQVYFDPFGQRTAGFREGMQDEMRLQDQTRRARVADWDYNNMAPLRLDAAQRQERLGAYGEPYAQRAFGINERTGLAGLYNAEQPIFDQTAAVLGDYSVARANRDMFNTGNYGVADQYRQPYAQYIQPLYQGGETRMMADIATQFGIDPQVLQQIIPMLSQFGQYSPQAERGQDEYNLYDRSRQQALDSFGITQNRASMEAAATNAATNAYNAQTLAHDRYNNRGQPPAALSGYTGEEDGLDGDF